MKNHEIKENILFQIKISDFTEKTEGLEEWLSNNQGIPESLSEFKTIPSDTTLGGFLKKAKDKLFSLYGDKRDHAKSFADSRFTSIDEMIERGMVSCGAMTLIFGTLLREVGIPVKFVHGGPLGEGGGKDSRHSWLEIYDPLRNDWFEIDPTDTNFKMRPGAKRINVYHDWSELRKDYEAGNF